MKRNAAFWILLGFVSAVGVVQRLQFLDRDEILARQRTARRIYRAIQEERSELMEEIGKLEAEVNAAQTEYNRLLTHCANLRPNIYAEPGDEYEFLKFFPEIERLEKELAVEIQTMEAEYKAFENDLAVTKRQLASLESTLAEWPNEGERKWVLLIVQNLKNISEHGEMLRQVNEDMYPIIDELQRKEREWKILDDLQSSGEGWDPQTMGPEKNRLETEIARLWQALSPLEDAKTSREARLRGERFQQYWRLQQLFLLGGKPIQNLVYSLFSAWNNREKLNAVVLDAFKGLYAARNALGHY